MNTQRCIHVETPRGASQNPHGEYTTQNRNEKPQRCIGRWIGRRRATGRLYNNTCKSTTLYWTLDWTETRHGAPLR